MTITALAHDIALKQVSQTPNDQKPHFAWREVVGSAGIQIPAVMIEYPHGEEEFLIGDLADMLGRAMVDVALAAGVTDIFTEERRSLLLVICREVATCFSARSPGEGVVRLSLVELYELLEKTLIENNAFMVAKSLLLERAHKRASRATPTSLGLRIIRRNQQVAPWSEQKIEFAVRKTFLSLGLGAPMSAMSDSLAIAQAVTARVVALKQSFIYIEDVQDMVQEELMKAGQYKAAAAYILFRAQRAAKREADGNPIGQEKTLLPAQKTMVMVKQPNGETIFWDGAELRKRIEFARIGLDLCLSNDEIEMELRRSVYDQMSQKDLDATIILNSKTLIEKDADFAKFAGRIQLTYIYEEVLGWNILRDGAGALKVAHQRAFQKYLEHGVAIKRLNPVLLNYDLAKLAESLDPSADLEFDFLGIQTLYDRYLIVDKTNKQARRIETPQFFWMRVAMGLMLEEKNDREGRVSRLYDLYKSRRFCSSTPTLFNSGTLHSQLSSCYLYYVDDSIEGIMYRGIAENAFLSKWAGGLGGSWTAVRGTGSHIGGTNGESQGVIPFLKLHNDQLVAVNQGGKRKGSGCAYLETWHNDILEFLELRKNTGDDRRRAHDMNTANWIPDLFMKRMEARQSWTLFRSNETPDLHELYGAAFDKRYVEYEKLAESGKIYGHKIEALELWKKMLSMIFETGHPWITFKDPSNIRSPQDHVGVVHSSNLCTEIILNTSKDETAVCNLGSVILETHLLPDGSIDHAKLRETIGMAVRALDNVIDINFYPTAPAKTANMRHRPVGLGVMGLAHALYMKGIPFASEAALNFSDEAMEAIAYYAYEASSDLAAERGTYSSYKGSKWDRGLLPQDTIELLEKERGMTVDVPRGGKLDWAPLRAKIAAHGMRNSNVLAIAPTATISNITATSPCIEPTYKNLFVKSNLSGEFIVLNPFLVKDLKARGLWDQDMVDNLKYFDGELKDIDRVPADLKARYMTAFDIDSKWVIEAAARRQKWIDQAQSVNLWIGTPDLKTLSHMYRHAWRVGLKTTYYLRSLGASTIEKSTVAVKKEMRGAVKEGAGDLAAPAATGIPLDLSVRDGAGDSASKPEFTAEQKLACSIEAMRNGEVCEVCQ
jgi:ribonucleoside-diphosphate reductase alpha chain